MTKAEQRLQLKATALNAIRKIYNTHYKFPYDEWDDDSAAEQREYTIKCIILTLEEDLKKLNK